MFNKGCFTNESASCLYFDRMQIRSALSASPAATPRSKSFCVIRKHQNAVNNSIGGLPLLLLPLDFMVCPIRIERGKQYIMHDDYYAFATNTCSSSEIFRLADGPCACVWCGAKSRARERGIVISVSLSRAHTHAGAMRRTKHSNAALSFAVFT